MQRLWLKERGEPNWHEGLGNEMAWETNEEEFRIEYNESKLMIIAEFRPEIVILLTTSTPKEFNHLGQIKP